MWLGIAQNWNPNIIFFAEFALIQGILSFAAARSVQLQNHDEESRRPPVRQPKKKKEKRASALSDESWGNVRANMYVSFPLIERFTILNGHTGREIQSSPWTLSLGTLTFWRSKGTSTSASLYPIHPVIYLFTILPCHTHGRRRHGALLKVPLFDKHPVTYLALSRPFTILRATQDGPHGALLEVHEDRLR